MTAIRRLILSLIALGLVGCGTVPLVEHETRSYAWAHPEQTPIGAYVASHKPGDDESLSGVYLLEDPRDAFRARFSLAKRAKHTLDMQYYLWKGDLTGQLLLYSALEAADRGVKVRLLIDDIYHSGRDNAYAVIDSHPNFEVRIFNPMKNRNIGKNLNYVLHRRKLNHRMHNKIFLADNAATVMGGRNIGDDYFGVDEDLNFHDLDVLAVGPVAAEAGAAFDLYWNSPAAVPISAIDPDKVDDDALERGMADLREFLDGALGDIPYDVPYDPATLDEELDRFGRELTWARARVVVDPLDRFEGAETAFAALGREVIADAGDLLTIQTAYLIPTDATIEGMAALVDRGVRVRVMTNSLMSNNHVSVHGHYRKYRKRLLEAGVELYELRADAALLDHYKEQDKKLSHSHAGMHTKAFVIDDDVSIIGSYNMDPRSRVWNSEIALVIYSEEFGRKVLDVMDEEFDSDNAYRLDLDDRGKVTWRLDCEGCTQTWTKEPESTFWKRFSAGFIGLLPIENEL
ncbi:MAG: phospholipase D family protein [Pseudomonadota bacterium]